MGKATLQQQNEAKRAAYLLKKDQKISSLQCTLDMLFSCAPNLDLTKNPFLLVLLTSIAIGSVVGEINHKKALIKEEINSNKDATPYALSLNQYQIFKNTLFYFKSAETITAYIQKHKSAEEAAEITNKDKRLRYVEDKLIVAANKEGAIKGASDFIKSSIIDVLKLIDHDDMLETLVVFNVAIVVAEEEYMENNIPVDSRIASFMLNYNTILLNEIIFKKWSPARSEQLWILLKNEIMHALVYNHHPDKNNSDTDYGMLLPWCNTEDQRYSKFWQAYDAFRQRVVEYRKLASYKKLSISQKLKLKAYDGVMDKFVVPRFGAEGYNLMQDFLYKREDGEYVLLRDIINELPPEDQPDARLRYLREGFFRVVHRMNAYLEGIEFFDIEKLNYQIAELISDWGMLTREMQKTFSPELVEFFDAYVEEARERMTPVASSRM